MANTSTPSVIENSDKYLVLLIPYLIFISCLYYYGYWGMLNIDIFPYIGVEDLIKGIAFPLQYPLFRIAAYSIGIFFSNYSITYAMKSRPISAIRLTKALVIFTMSTGLVWLGLTDYDNSDVEIGIPVTVTAIILTVSYFVIAILMQILDTRTFDVVAVTNGFELRVNVRNCITEVVSLSLIALIPFSYFSGFYDAKNIVNKTSYYYINNDNYKNNNLINKYKNLIYLGKFNDYIFFSTFDNTKHIILNKDSLPTIILYKYINIPKNNSTKTKQTKTQ